jgi:hypothetical protein
MDQKKHRKKDHPASGIGPPPPRGGMTEIIIEKPGKGSNRGSHPQKREPSKKHEPDSQVAMAQKFSEQYTLNIIGSGGGVSTFALSVNPGDPTMFPRLNQVAQLFTKWRFKWLKVIWQPSGSAFTVGNQAGEIGLNVSSDWYASAPSSIAVQRSRRPSMTGDAWTPKTLFIKPGSKLLQPWRFTRGGQGHQGADARLFDLMTYLVVSGSPNTNAIGFVLFEGEVEFCLDFTPTTNPPNTNRIHAAQSSATQNYTSGVYALVSTAGTYLINSLQSGVDWTFGPTAGRFYPGTYKVTFQADIVATTITTYALTIIPDGLVGGMGQLMGNGINQISGSTFSASVVHVHGWAVFNVIESMSTSGVLVNIAGLTINGTGTITLTNWTCSVEAY